MEQSMRLLNEQYDTYSHSTHIVDFHHPKYFLISYFHIISVFEVDHSRMIDRANSNLLKSIRKSKKNYQFDIKKGGKSHINIRIPFSKSLIIEKIIYKLVI
jgi:hypothetical protein